MNLVRLISFAFAFVFIYPRCIGQVLDILDKEDTEIDTSEVHDLRLELDAIGFFRDNEYNSKMQNGYSLPGVRMNPHLEYTPLEQIKIEAGASLLLFNGANKYPCYVYHDIGTWKGNQYQPGAHVLPWARLQASFKHLDVILGNIYGGSNHGLIAPLYNTEQTISTDPEMGLQLLWKLPRFTFDAWINWQSYQFELDTHQEAFTVGLCSEIRWNKSSLSGIQIYSPIQVVVQHRGGEQDITNLGVQTIGNASIGAGIRKNFAGWFNGFDAFANTIGCYQQSGNLWPFEIGFMSHAGISASAWKHINARLDYTYTPKQFMSLYGNPFYNSLPIKNGGTQIQEDGSLIGRFEQSYDKLHNLHLELGYHYTFAKAYSLGADMEIYYHRLKDFNFSFGAYLRVAPSILLKKFTN